MPITSVRPVHIRKYMDKASKKHGNTATNHDLQVIRHVYTKAVDWGLIDTNPIKGQIRKIPTSPRTRYIEDWEIEEFLNLKPKILHGL